MKNKIVVTGADGQLGRCLQDIATEYSQYQFVFTDIQTLDITNSDAVARFLDAECPGWVINAAAYTAVDKAQSEPDKARLLNATAVGFLARESARIGAGLVHISTDYVFRGEECKILTESAPTDPQSVYGITKLEGEREAQQNQRHIIFRTSWLYSAYGNNFVKTMRRLGAERDELSVVCDQWGSPTLADDLATAVMTAIAKLDNMADSGPEVYGLYHFSNEGATSWADFAEQILDLSGVDCRVKSITTAEYGATAPRPLFSVMSKAKFSETFQAVIPEWELSLERLIERLDATTASR